MLLDALILLIVASCAVDTWFFLARISFTGEIFDFIFLTCSNMSPRIFFVLSAPISVLGLHSDIRFNFFEKGFYMRVFDTYCRNLFSMLKNTS